jgi:hypothetical protein
MTSHEYFKELYAADDVCRAHPARTADPCPRCGYVPAQAPAWATHGATFALAGLRFRVVAVGSTNQHAPRGLHYEDAIRVEPAGDERWQLAETPCPVDDVAASLRGLFSLPTLRPLELARAYLIEGPRA